MRILALTALIALLGLTDSAFALGLKENLTDAHVETLTKYGNFLFAPRALNGASSKGLVFGVEAGLAANLAKTDDLQSIPGLEDFEGLGGFAPAPMAVAAVGLPMGIGLELQGLMLPTIKGVGFYSFGGNLFWASQEVLKLIPVVGGIIAAVPFLNVAPRLSYSQYGLTMQQTKTVSGVDSKVDAELSGSTYGGNLAFSAKVPPISFGFYAEPYFGIGYMGQSGEATALIAGSTSVGGVGVSASTEKTVKSDDGGIHYYAGLELKLFLIDVVGEYDHMFDSDSYSAKLSFKF